MLPDEGKAPATPRVALLGQVDIANVSVLLKQRHQIVGHRTEMSQTIKSFFFLQFKAGMRIQFWPKTGSGAPAL